MIEGSFNDVLGINAENFVDVDVAALGIDLGVVLVKGGDVHSVVSGNLFADIILDDFCEDK